MVRLYILFLVISSTTYSQYKLEREYRISSDKVPSTAKIFLEKCNFNEKVKWFIEESQSGKSFEAKTFFNKNKFSIEFDENGNLIDTEITVKFTSLPLPIQSKINNTLSNRFDKYKIEKTQIQYSGLKKNIYESILAFKVGQNKTASHYELVVKGKKLKSYFRYEFLFNYEGDILKELQFSLENSDNLEF